MTARGRALASMALAVALALTGCSSLGGDQAAAPTPSWVPSIHTPPPGAEALTKYYTQRLHWSSCGDGQCTTLEVPLDYAHPDKSIEISVLKVPARSTDKRIGSLVVNPGGPGGSGFDYAAAANVIVGGPVRDRFDVVGFDPRGVGRSEPIRCLEDRGLDSFLGQDPTPVSRSEEQVFADSSQSFAVACQANAGALLAHVSTEDVARDMDVLRAALGDTKLNYLGKSYGTFLGARYAGLFPRKVGRFVLDGVVPPDLTSEQINLGQAAGFEVATRQWAQSCVDGGDCPLGRTQDEVMAGLRGLFQRLDAHPVPLPSDPTVKQLTEGWASIGIASAMYDQGSWGTLTDAVKDVVKKNDGAALMALADQYADRRPDGHYVGNIMQVLYAVNCLDRPDTKELSVHEAAAKEASVKAPTWGPLITWSSLPCGYWPVKGTSQPAKVTAKGSGPIVVVGTTRDPATPYEWSVRLRKELANASLVTWDGDGHTAYMRSNSCVNNAIDGYYVKGTVPRDGMRC